MTRKSEEHLLLFVLYRVAQGKRTVSSGDKVATACITRKQLNKGMDSILSYTLVGNFEPFTGCRDFEPQAVLLLQPTLFSPPAPLFPNSELAYSGCFSLYPVDSNEPRTEHTIVSYHYAPGQFGELQFKMSSYSGALRVEGRDLKEVCLGKQTATFRHDIAAPALEDTCFSLMTSSRTFDLEATSLEDRDNFVSFLQVGLASAGYSFPTHGNPPREQNMQSYQNIQSLDMFSATELIVQSLPLRKENKLKTTHSTGRHIINDSTCGTGKENLASNDVVVFNESSTMTPDEALTMMVQGMIFMKYPRGNGSPYTALVFYAPDDGRLFWCKASKRERKSKRSVALTSITEVYQGKRTKVFAKKVFQNLIADRCFSIITPKRTLDLSAPSKKKRDAFLYGISIILFGGFPGAGLHSNLNSEMRVLQANFQTRERMLQTKCEELKQKVHTLELNSLEGKPGPRQEIARLHDKSQDIVQPEQPRLIDLNREVAYSSKPASHLQQKRKKLMKEDSEAATRKSELLSDLDILCARRKELSTDEFQDSVSTESMILSQLKSLDARRERLAAQMEHLELCQTVYESVFADDACDPESVDITVELRLTFVALWLHTFCTILESRLST